MKSGALVFLGGFLWAGSLVLLSVRPQWTALYLLVAYGFLLVFWGPLTHLGIVPLVLRFRRQGSHPVTRFLGRHGGKLNLTIFISLVIVLAAVQPSFMLLEFSLPLADDPSPSVQGELTCEGPIDGLITCEVRNAQGIDHVVILSGGVELARADEPPFHVKFHTDDLVETRIGKEYRVQYRNADGSILQQRVRTVRP